MPSGIAMQSRRLAQQANCHGGSGLDSRPKSVIHPRMTEIERNILHALVELDQIVATMPHTNPKPDLKPLFARIDELASALPGDSDPTLMHYLHKKSYQKARLFLEGRDAENQAGNCGHV
jgi:hypothetical protein